MLRLLVVSILTISSLSAVLTSQEVYELLARIDVLLVWVVVEATHLLQLPLLSLGELLSASLLLSCSGFSLARFTLFIDTLALISSRFLLLLVFFGAFSSLLDHQLCLGDPLDVLNESLLNLVVAHASIEGLLQVILLLFKLPGALEALLNFNANVCDVVLLQFLARIKFCLFSLLF